jgi:hypothetical protein
MLKYRIITIPPVDETIIAHRRLDFNRSAARLCELRATALRAKITTLKRSTF